MDSNRYSEIETIRHSFSHILAMAVMRLFKDTKLGIGPAVDNGFYHDFLFSNPIGNKELEQIEAEMHKIIEEELPFQQISVPKEQAFDILHLQGQVFKTEILSKLTDSEVTFYKTGQEFMDLCRGPHVDNTGKLGAFKLIGISGVYWDNDESRPNMQRIHGLAFKTQEQLDKYLDEQNKKIERDHRTIAAQLELCLFEAENGAGLPIWLPRGMAIRRIIMNYLHKENNKIGQKYVQTPLISRTQIFRDSGDLEKGKNFMFPPIVLENEYSLKPRSVVHHIQIFKSKKRSYKNLPFRISEFDTTFRNEKSGELSGLSRVRSFTSDSNTIICSHEELLNELTKAFQLTKKIYDDFQLKNYKAELAMKGPNDNQYLGNPKEWLKAQNTLAEAAKNSGLTIYEAPNTANILGPAINFMFPDVRARQWKIGSIQIDITAPTVFKLNYVDSKNKKKQPEVFYRTSIGSIERFFAFIVEHFGGAFPLWLSPVHVNIIPISEKYVEYAQKICDELIENDLNVEIDMASETMQNKIRQSQLQMIPYMLILGEKELDNDTVSVRPRSGQDLGLMKVSEFIQKIKKEIEEKINF